MEGRAGNAAAARTAYAQSLRYCPANLRWKVRARGARLARASERASERRGRGKICYGHCFPCPHTFIVPRGGRLSRGREGGREADVS